MMRAAVFLCVLAVAVPLRENRWTRYPPPPTAPGSIQIYGMWQLTKVDIGQKEMALPDVNDKKLQILEDKLKTFDKGAPQPQEDAAYKIDWTKQPATIDIMPGNLPAGAKSLQGILKLDGDTLILALGMEGRPATFVPDATRPVIVMYLKRVNP